MSKRTRTRVLPVDPERPEPHLIHEAAGLLRRGGLVAFPTETVYGLGANLEDPQAIQELYQVKERPFEKRVTLHVADRAAVESQGAVVSPLARRLMEEFWPGPLTLVLPRAEGSTMGFRMPNHPVALALLSAAAVPVVAPSANLSGRPPPRKAEEVLEGLQDKIDLLLDAGPTPLGGESTVLDLSGREPRILRPGALRAEIEGILSQR
ncbi:MAG: threonylcarbamoyl-AMP synthase [Candidatus Omnitrophica bacterium]|nr:threonylcarbamoyl-AMP synthase [Candidatus Omnitrophota bacterium]